MSVYICTVSELQHFVMQPLILLGAVNLQVLILKIHDSNVGFLQIRSHTIYNVPTCMYIHAGDFYRGKASKYPPPPKIELQQYQRNATAVNYNYVEKINVEGFIKCTSVN